MAEALQHTGDWCFVLLLLFSPQNKPMIERRILAPAPLLSVTPTFLRVT